MTEAFELVRVYTGNQHKQQKELYMIEVGNLTRREI